MNYTDVDERYQILLGKEGSRVYTDGSLTVTTKIETPVTVWRSIAAGEIWGDEAMMQGLYKVKGDYTLMLKWDNYFGGSQPQIKQVETRPPQKKTNMNIMLIPWIVLLVAPAIHKQWGCLITLGVCALVPLFYYRNRKTFYDILTNVLVIGASVIMLAGGSEKRVLPLSYLSFGLAQYDLSCTICTTIQEAGCLLNSRVFHLLIVDLEYLRSIRQVEWLAEIRRISFVPVIVLLDTPEEDMRGMVQLGADMCISDKNSNSMIADLSFVQLRRCTEYNHYNGPTHAETMSFRVGDIFIDPTRHIVKVRGQSVNLRLREFSMLLYFMRNPNIVLTSDQICEYAWGMEDSYNQDVSHSVRLLRQAIAPAPLNPVYIKTVHRVGYCFTAYNSEAFDMC